MKTATVSFDRNQTATFEIYPESEISTAKEKYSGMEYWGKNKRTITAQDWKAFKADPDESELGRIEAQAAIEAGLENQKFFYIQVA